jgi:hypothetical protein
MRLKLAKLGSPCRSLATARTLTRPALDLATLKLMCVLRVLSNFCAPVELVTTTS